jgi:outer membrane lipoprotein-sorting protein
MKSSRRHRLALLCLGLVWSSIVSAGAAHADKPSAKAPTSAKELFAGLAKLPGLTASFHEEKHLSVLVEPLVSEGTVAFAPPDRLIRVTRTPIWSSLIVKESSITYTDDAGKQELSMAQDHPARAFVQVFVDVIRGDLASIQKRFELSFSTTSGESWTLSLRPRKQKELAEIKQIRLDGSGLAIASMEVVEASGDRAVTTFSSVTTSRSPTSKEIAAMLKKPRE